MIIVSWATEEMKGINLGDKRLNERLLNLFDKLGNAPSLSIPAACRGGMRQRQHIAFLIMNRLMQKKSYRRIAQQQLKESSNKRQYYLFRIQRL